MASSDKYFVIAIGGTGMRCLEAFTHMCAMGLFDTKEINILTLDTDAINGNKERTENLIRQYNSIKTTSNAKGGKVNTDTFFSAKLNLFSFYTDYDNSERANFKQISQIHSDPDGNNKLLADLFLDEHVQDFNLAHGYRAQTHLGSYLMYHAFIEAAKSLQAGTNIKAHEKEFGEFINMVYDAGGDAKIFCFGSVFGGTGASSIPVIPKAINDAIKIRGGDKMALSPDAKFGATLLTEYFSFKKPDAAQKSKDGNAVIADSSFFTLNSQAALQFYQDDPTVKSTYKKMYHIGWPIDPLDFSKDNKDKETITGGKNQKNPCHITEFLCSCAAFDFFNSDEGLDGKDAVYLYKSVKFKDNVLNLNFNDFIGDGKNGKLFARKFGAFVSFMHLALSKNKGARGDNGVKGFLNQLKSQNIHHYNSLEDQYTSELNDYLKQFGYSIDQNAFVPGWLYQVRSTVPGKFVLDDKTYTHNLNELEKFDAGMIFTEKDYHWTGAGSFLGDSYNTFVKELLEVETEPKEEQHCSGTNEKFLAHIYNAIRDSQKIN